VSSLTSGWVEHPPESSQRIRSLERFGVTFAMIAALPKAMHRFLPPFPILRSCGEGFFTEFRGWRLTT
jgi:hypothetical protein